MAVVDRVLVVQVGAAGFGEEALPGQLVGSRQVGRCRGRVGEGRASGS